jgi:two-component system, cell cycle sensor histidine kinase and response regulator CckA
VGYGTTFRIDFPTGSLETTPRHSTQPALGAPERQKVVLVAEDEETLGRMVQRILVRAGYHVLLSTSAAAAEQKVREFPGKIDLLLTDVVMPGDSGLVLTERLLGRLPELRVLFMSGFPGDAVAQHGLATYSQFFLAKPFTPTHLIAKVAEVIAFKG